MKISIEQAQHLLSLIGVTGAEIVTDDKEADQGLVIDDVANSVTETVIANNRPFIENDLRKHVEDGIVGRTLGTMRSAIGQRFGIKTSDLKDLEIADIVAKAHEKAGETIGKDNSELRAEMERIVSENNAAIEAIKAEYERQINEERSKVTESFIDDSLSLLVDEIPLKGGSKAAQVRALKSALRESYHLHHDADKKVTELRDKSNNELPVRDGNKILQLKDAATKHFEELGLLVTDMRHVNPNNVNGGNAAAGVQTVQSSGDDMIDFLNSMAG